MNTALLVIDMQNDYLCKNRMKRFAYDTERLVSSVNHIIHRYNAEDRDVIYIRHIIQNLPTNRLLFGYSIAGTEGAELYKGLDIVSDYIFDKLVGDALSNKKLRQLIERNYNMIWSNGDAAHVISAMYTASIVSGEPRVDEESYELRFFSRDEFPDLFAEDHIAALDAYFKGVLYPLLRENRLSEQAMQMERRT